jgi:predicted nucleic acid-binding protein
MKLYFDTSALVKFFHEERGSSEVTAWVEDPQNEIWLMALARLEFSCVLFRRFRNNEIGELNLNRALSAFEKQLAAFDMQPLGPAILNEAEILLKKYGKNFGLRTLDALHLGAFVLIADDDWGFVSADNNLCQLVSSLGYNVLFPKN